MYAFKACSNYVPMHGVVGFKDEELRYNSTGALQ